MAEEAEAAAGAVAAAAEAAVAAAEPAAGATPEADDDRGDAGSGGDGGGEGGGGGEEGSKKKKKKKKSSSSSSAVPGRKASLAAAGPVVDGCGNEFVRGEIYDYVALLSRVQELIDENNPTLQGSRKYTIKPPTLARVGSKKVAWTNFTDICRIMGRSPDHVLHFVLAELGTEGSVGGDGQLTLKGKFGPKHIESLLRKYITEYVTCSMCKSPNTELKKDSSTRLFNIYCSACGATRSVTTIKSGFHAVSRADRRKAKQAAV